MNLLEALAGELLSGAANTGLALDPNTLEALARLEGAALRLELKFPPQTLVLRVTEGNLRIQPGSEYPAQTIVRGSITDLLSLLRTGSASPRLEISGDPALLSRFEAVLQGFRPDLDGLIPEALTPGSVDANSPAEQWLGLLEEGLDSVRRATTGALRQGQAALQGTLENSFASRTDVALLEREADELRLAIDRLDARLALHQRERAPEDPGEA